MIRGITALPRLESTLQQTTPRMGTFDSVGWHDEIPRDMAVTHIAMFVGWAISRDLLASHHREDPSASWYIGRILERERTAADFVIDFCRSRLNESDLSREGAAFGRLYYGRYLHDYQRVFPEAASIYEVADTWDNFDRLTVILDRRLAQFRRWCARHTEVREPVQDALPGGYAATQAVWAVVAANEVTPEARPAM